jgi:NitT/TauT family transport system permease protein
VYTRVLETLILIVIIIAIWQLLFEAVGAIALASPWTTVTYLIDLLQRSSFLGNIASTAIAFGYAVIISAGLGVSIGSVLGLHRFSGDVADPILTALYSIPKITLYPVVLLIFGLGLSSKVAFGVIHGVIPVIIFTMNGIKNMNPAYLKTGRVLRLSATQMITRILIPACLPEIVAGLRMGFALTLLGVLIGEMFASQHGLGYLIMKSINVNDVKMITAVILLLFLFAVTLSMLMLALQHKLSRAN